MDIGQTTALSLKADKLSCVRNEYELFSQLSFNLSPGELIQIEGANGSGKTSLLRILCGLSLAADGNVLWNDQPIEQCRAEYYASMAYVGHHNGLKSNLTCEENLQASAIHNQLKTNVDIEEALAIMQVDDLIDEYAGKLSAGQQRRVALTRLLITEAPLWILDEPFTAIDHVSRERLEQLFDQHCQQGGMIVLTTHHDLNIANTPVKLIRIDAA